MEWAQRFRLNFRIDSLYEETSVGHEVIHDLRNCVLMQFTGLKDKNGKEIYEGDIVKDQDGIIDSVEFSDAMFSYNIFALVAKSYLPEVIGNIYENPDLLKATNE